MTNHIDIVRSVAEQHPPDGTSLNGLLQFLLNVIAALPASEQAGLLRKDTGDNVVLYAPAGVNISASRLCYPDGSIVKVLTDAGVGGTNGPDWTPNGTVDPQRYIAVPAVVEPPVLPPVDPPLPPVPALTLEDIKQQQIADTISILAAVQSVRDDIQRIRDDVRPYAPLLLRFTNLFGLRGE